MAGMLYQHLPDLVGVVGAGQMGTGIAQVLASQRFKVLLSDRTFDIIEKSLSCINRSLEKKIRAGTMSQEEATALVSRIEGNVSLEPFRKADFVSLLHVHYLLHAHAFSAACTCFLCRMVSQSPTRSAHSGYRGSSRGRGHQESDLPKVGPSYAGD